MSPEQAQGEKVDNRSDIYGLGVIVFQMLSGKQPYNADTPMGVAIKHVTDPVPEILKFNPGLPEATDTVIKTALAKNKDERYSSATDLSHALTQVAHGEDVTGSPPSKARRGAKASGGRRGVLFGVLAVLVIAMAGGYFFREPLFAMILPPTPTATLTATATLPPTPTVIPTGTSAPTETATVIPFAAFCHPDTLQIPLPVVRETNKTCVEKFPYTTVSIPLGATFESLSPEMTCTISKTQVNDILVVCTGPQLHFYQLKVCNPPPVIPASEPGRCAEGDSFDAANQCCLKPTAEGAGCTEFQIDLKSCAE
jgi:hypothetical protein